MKIIRICTVISLSIALFAAENDDLLRTIRTQFVSALSEPPSVTALTVPETTGQYEKLEMDIELKVSYTNPFDPEDILVNAVITKPNGETVVVPAFYAVPYEPENGLTQMTGSLPYRKLGPGVWKVRFSSAAVGVHTVAIAVRDSKGQKVSSEPRSFSVIPSKARGFVRIAEKNPNYFERTDGSAFFGSGANVPWTRIGEKAKGVPSYEHYFSRASGMISSTRVWLCHWAWLEWMPSPKSMSDRGYGGLGYYNQMIACQLDRVFALAESNEFAVMLTLEDNNEHMNGTTYDSWKFNPYNTANGGVAGTGADFISSPAVRPWYKKRLRYIIARWGYSRSLWALNGFNDYDDANEHAMSFITEMRDCAHRLTEGWRPMIYGANYKRTANERMDYAQGATTLAKPGVVQECYFTEDERWFKDSLHTELWDNFAKGVAAVMVWEHTKVDRTDAWPLFKHVLDFASDLPLASATWRPAAVRVVKASAAGSSFSRVIVASAYGDIPDWGAKSLTDTFTIDAGENAVWLTGMSRTLYAKRSDRIAWRVTPSFTIDMPGNGRFIARVDEIGSGNQTLTAAVDGAQARSTVYAGGRRELKPDEQWFDVPLAAGARTVTLALAEGDWLRVGKYFVVIDIDDAKGLIGAKGLSSAEEAFAYLPNITYGQLYQSILKRDAVAVNDVQVEFSGLVGGVYAVRIIDPVSGSLVGESETTAAGGHGVRHGQTHRTGCGDQTETEDRTLTEIQHCINVRLPIYCAHVVRREKHSGAYARHRGARGRAPGIERGYMAA
ncbi:MAG: DUF5060 domain-containing protein [Spirochaetota bacterium]